MLFKFRLDMVDLILVRRNVVGDVQKQLMTERALPAENYPLQRISWRQMSKSTQIIQQHVHPLETHELTAQRQLNR